MALRVGNPGTSRLTAQAAAFISTEGPDIHIAMAGSSIYDDEERRFVPPNFHKSVFDCENKEYADRQKKV
jgi:hypothetical protein